MKQIHYPSGKHDTPSQTFALNAVFTTFFVPCFMSIKMMGKEIEWKTAIQSVLLTLLLAILLATTIRFLATLIPV